MITDTLRLARADALKLRRRRGMIAVVLAETIGIPLLIYTIKGLQHAGDPAKYGPAGGSHSYQLSLPVLQMFVVVAGAIVGATAGAADLETGVFRDLAATGRSRVALFGSRILGSWTIVIPITATVAAVDAIGSTLLAGSLPAPTASTIAAGTTSLILAGAVGAAVSVGLAALFGSRGPVVAIVLAFQLAISPLLAKVTFLGDVRQTIPKVAFDRIAGGPQKVHIALATALVVALAWTAVAFITGAWRTKTREI